MQKSWRGACLQFGMPRGLVICYVLIGGILKGKLQELVSEFVRMFERRKLRVNVNRSKVIRFSSGNRQVSWSMSLNGRYLEEVKWFRYLGVDIAANGIIEADVSHRVGKRANDLSPLRNMCKEGTLSVGVKKSMFDSIVVPTGYCLYRCEVSA